MLMGVGKWFGYALFGFFADSRRAATKVLDIFIHRGDSRAGLWNVTQSDVAPGSGPVLGFFGIGFFSGFAAIASEIFPTEIRATAMGLSYNVGRGISALAPFAVGAIATRYSFNAAFYLLAAAFFVSAVLALALPETKGKVLE